MVDRAEHNEVTQEEIIEAVTKIVTRSVIISLNDKGYLNPTKMRDTKIRDEFNRMVRDDKITKTRAIEILSQKVYCSKNGNKQILTEESIQKIVWPSGNKK